MPTKAEIAALRKENKTALEHGWGDAACGPQQLEDLLDHIEALEKALEEKQAILKQRGMSLLLAAELLNQAAKDIDEMFPNDEHPEMQQDLRKIAAEFRAALKGG